MCRWMAYAGPSIYLESLLFQQKNSLISQSLKATKSNFVTNGDGFGVAWYGKRDKPGLFKDVLPAWNDENLREISQHIESNLFFAHVRAATGTSVSRTNCHPYSYKNWSFMHNGMIGNWQLNRRDIESLIAKDLYHLRLGTTDSEALFLLALTEGLEEDPIAGMSKAVAKVLKVMEKNGSTDPLRISAALSDGKSIWAFRFSSDRQSPSLYYGTPDTHSGVSDTGLVSTIASEPFDDEEDGSWAGVCEGSALHWMNGHVCLSPFEPTLE
jgi:predicted glutamine amidotransferase